MLFDLDGDGRAVRTGWTAAGSDDAFIALDLNGNGRIDSGRELLGSAFRGPDGKRVTGYESLRVIQGLPPKKGEADRRALAEELEKAKRQSIEINGQRIAVPALSANSPGTVSRLDAVFSRLRAWTDTNHNGKSEPRELRSLIDLGVLQLRMGFGKPSNPPLDKNGNRTYLFGTFSTGAGSADSKPMVYVQFARR